MRHGCYRYITTSPSRSTVYTLQMYVYLYAWTTLQFASLSFTPIRHSQLHKLALIYACVCCAVLSKTTKEFECCARKDWNAGVAGGACDRVDNNSKH